MADLSGTNADLPVGITGLTTGGVPTTPVGADSNGNMLVKDYSNGPVSAGTAALASSLSGGQYNSTLPTLTAGQQSAIQLDSSGRLITSPQTITVGVADKSAFTYGTTSDLVIGGVYQDTAPTLTAGTSGAARLTANRAIHVNLRDSSGNEKLGSQLSSASIPVVVASDQVLTGIADGPSTTAGTPATRSTLIGGVYNSAQPTLTTGQQLSAQMDITGAIRVNATGSTTALPSDLSGSGTITALNGVVTAAINGCSSIVWNLTGTWSAGLSFQGTVDNINWFPVQAIFVETNTVANNWYSNANLNVACGGFKSVRLIALSYTSGTVAIAWDASAGSNFTWSYVYNETPTNLQTLNNALETSNSYPSPYNVVSYNPSAQVQDSLGNLQVRGPVITDEGSFRDDFTGTSLVTNLSGTVDFQNGSTAISGTGGTLFNTQVGIDQYIKNSTDSESYYTQVASVNNSSSLNLVAPYGGTSNTGATANLSNWKTTTGSGSLVVASSILTINSGTAVSTTSIVRDIDYVPLSLTSYASISQRIANQTAILGFVDDSLNPAAVVQFTGTNNTQVNFITAFSGQAYDVQTTLVTLPNGALTSASNQYSIDISPIQGTLSINGIVVAVNTLHLPAPYTDLQCYAGITNSAVVTTTAFAIDSIYAENVDRLQVANDFSGESLAIEGSSNSGQADNNAAPVKIGAIYNATLPTYSTGQRVDVQADSNGRLITSGSITNALPTGANVIGGVTQSGTWSIAPLTTTTLINANAIPVDGTKATYSATSAIAFASAATPTDIFTITGSASKVVRVLRIGFSATQTTAATNNILLVKRTTANTAGTSAAATAVAHDSTDSAGSATVLSYTANPTLGTVAGTVRAIRAFIPTVGSSAATQFYEFDFGNLPEKCLVLRGVTQVLSINLNSTTVSGGAFTCFVSWTEE